MTRQAGCVVVILSVVSALNFNGVEYKPVPRAGWMRSDCVHTVAPGSSLEIVDGAFESTLDGVTLRMPKCAPTKVAPLLLTKPALNAALALDNENLRGRKLQVKDIIWFDSFTSTFSVPAMPAALPQVLYLFPGLQDVDWVPVVDPEPPAGQFDIIQPVLEYPDQATGRGWSVRSWWVTLDLGAASSTELALPPGAAIFGNMTKTSAAGDWYIGSTYNGRTTSVIARARTIGTRLTKQPWAYATCECYGCTGCSTYPTNTEIFTNMTLMQAGKSVMPMWAINPKPSKNHFCKEAITTTADGSGATISFQ